MAKELKQFRKKVGKLVFSISRLFLATVIKIVLLLKGETHRSLE